MQFPRPQSRQIVDHGSGCARIASDDQNLMSNSACFQTWLCQLGRDFQILIEEEVAQNGNSMSRKHLHEFFESGMIHRKVQWLKSYTRNSEKSTLSRVLYCSRSRLRFRFEGPFPRSVPIPRWKRTFQQLSKFLAASIQAARSINRGLQGVVHWTKAVSEAEGLEPPKK